MAVAAENLAANDDSGNGDSWKWFATFCYRLEAMAQKQLRGIEWNDTDRDFFGKFKTSIGCSDHLRAATVAQAADGKVLIVAAGPHRTILVNYPWQGQTHLCYGAVMTFYTSTAPTPLTDAEWEDQFYRSPLPEPPDWLAPLAMPALTVSKAER